MNDSDCKGNRFKYGANFWPMVRLLEISGPGGCQGSLGESQLLAITGNLNIGTGDIRKRDMVAQRPGLNVSLPFTIFYIRRPSL